MNACDLFIFAAGIGSRLRPHTEETPKPCIPLFSTPLGFYILPYLEEIPVNNRVINTFHLPDQIKAQYTGTFSNVKFSDEIGSIKGSAGGLKQAESLFSKADSIVAVNADEVFFADDPLFLKKAIEHHQKIKNFATLVVMDHPSVGKEFGGIWCDGDRIVSIDKKMPESLKTKYPNLKGWHFIGFQILSNEVLSLINSETEQNIFYDILIQHLSKQKCDIYKVTGDWYETGSVKDYSYAKEKIQSLKSSDAKYKWLFEKLNRLPKSPLPDIS